MKNFKNFIKSNLHFIGLIVYFTITILVLFLPYGTTGAEQYSRSEFGHGWKDFNKDCFNTRQEILILQGVDEVIDGCRVTSGTFYLPYSDETISNPSLIDIDHIVPLKHAWEAGASEWTKEERVMFANDPDNLIISHRSDNRSKGASAPHEWMPPNEDYHERYLRTWVHLKGKYSLEFSEEEREFIVEQLFLEKETKE